MAWAICTAVHMVSGSQYTHYYLNKKDCYLSGDPEETLVGAFRDGGPKLQLLTVSKVKQNAQTLFWIIAVSLLFVYLCWQFKSNVCCFLSKSTSLVPKTLGLGLRGQDGEKQCLNLGLSVGFLLQRSQQSWVNLF